MQTENIVEIIYDHDKNKLRAKIKNSYDSWVRFPVDLRIEGYEYKVKILVKGKGNSYIAKGTIEDGGIERVG